MILLQADLQRLVAVAQAEGTAAAVEEAEEAEMVQVRIPVPEEQAEIQVSAREEAEAHRLLFQGTSREEMEEMPEMPEIIALEMLLWVREEQQEADRLPVQEEAPVLLIMMTVAPAAVEEAYMAIVHFLIYF